MITPLPFGGGEGGGAIIFLKPCVFCSSVFICEKKYVIPYLSLCHSVLQKSPVSPRHSVILSSKKYLSPFVIMSLCLQKSICLFPSLCYSVFQKNICLPLSLCHSVFKKTSVSLSHYVILSENDPVGDRSGASSCCR